MRCELWQGGVVSTDREGRIRWLWQNGCEESRMTAFYSFSMRLEAGCNDVSCWYSCNNKTSQASVIYLKDVMSLFAVPVTLIWFIGSHTLILPTRKEVDVELRGKIDDRLATLYFLVDSLSRDTLMICGYKQTTLYERSNKLRVILCKSVWDRRSVKWVWNMFVYCSNIVLDSDLAQFVFSFICSSCGFPQGLYQTFAGPKLWQNQMAKEITEDWY